jgi:hypothetical protein
MRTHPTTQKLLLLRYFIALCIKLFINFAAAKVHKAAVAAETLVLLLPPRAHSFGDKRLLNNIAEYYILSVFKLCFSTLCLYPNFLSKRALIITRIYIGDARSLAKLNYWREPLARASLQFPSANFHLHLVRCVCVSAHTNALKFNTLSLYLRSCSSSSFLLSLLAAAFAKCAPLASGYVRSGAYFNIHRQRTFYGADKSS